MTSENAYQSSFGSVVLTQDAFLSEQWGVWAACRPAADDISPGLQEHTELAGKELQLAAGVNNQPYAPVGVSSRATIAVTYAKETFCGSSFRRRLNMALLLLGMYSPSSITKGHEFRAVYQFAEQKGGKQNVHSLQLKKTKTELDSGESLQGSDWTELGKMISQENTTFQVLLPRIDIVTPWLLSKCTGHCSVRHCKFEGMYLQAAYYN